MHISRENENMYERDTFRIRGVPVSDLHRRRTARTFMHARRESNISQCWGERDTFVDAAEFHRILDTGSSEYGEFCTGFCNSLADANDRVYGNGDGKRRYARNVYRNGERQRGERPNLHTRGDEHKPERRHRDTLVDDARRDVCLP